MRPRILLPLAVCTMLSYLTNAQTDQPAQDDIESLLDMSLEDLLNFDVKDDESFRLYGFFDSNFEKVFQEPAIGTNERTDSPAEWTPVKNFHLYGSGDLSDRISFLFNIAVPGGTSFEIRNAWANYRFHDALQVRVGKMYRKFGLYNEKLDQLPSFIGIEPPELFDTDHLFLSRTTSVMVHGGLGVRGGTLSYALTTENSEGGAKQGVVPAGWDLRWTSPEMGLIVGTSGFASNIGSAQSSPSVALGDGAPDGGILPWMEEGRYVVFGGFVEKQVGNLLLQMEYWRSNHEGLRNPTDVLYLASATTLNAHQRENFFGTAEPLPPDLMEDDVIREARFAVQTFYVRLGYNVQTRIGQFVPYVFYDWMSHPEIIQEKQYGGDNEAGLSDNGRFSKPSLGVVYRPIQTVAIKLDGSTHNQEVNGEMISYPEIRLDFSLAFDVFEGLRK